MSIFATAHRPTEKKKVPVPNKFELIHLTEDCRTTNYSVTEGRFKDNQYCNRHVLIECKINSNSRRLELAYHCCAASVRITDDDG
jgi:hypothetical protein